jgi:hypothetical protein
VKSSRLPSRPSAFDSFKASCRPAPRDSFKPCGGRCPPYIPSPRTTPQVPAPRRRQEGLRDTAHPEPLPSSRRNRNLPNFEDLSARRPGLTVHYRCRDYATVPRRPPGLTPPRAPLGQLIQPAKPTQRIEPIKPIQPLLRLNSPTAQRPPPTDRRSLRPRAGGRRVSETRRIRSPYLLPDGTGTSRTLKTPPPEGRASPYTIDAATMRPCRGDPPAPGAATLSSPQLTPPGTFSMKGGEAHWPQEAPSLPMKRFEYVHDL